MSTCAMSEDTADPSNPPFERLKGLKRNTWGYQEQTRLFRALDGMEHPAEMDEMGHLAKIGQLEQQDHETD
jgi:hypothetical protein